MNNTYLLHLYSSLKINSTLNFDLFCCLNDIRDLHGPSFYYDRFIVFNHVLIV